jgi:hypothetical protein
MNTTFKTLIETYPTSEALVAFLRSDAGGRLKVRDAHLTPESPLVVIHYDRTTSDMTVGWARAFRSVVWNMRTNRPLCVAPMRGAEFGAAVDAGLTGFTAEDFVDGVMINMFFDGAIWRLATRTQLDAGGSFYGKRPFAELFMEAFVQSGLKFDDFHKDKCYSFVLQHPEERVVVAPAYGIAKIVLVDAFALAEDGSFSVLGAAAETATNAGSHIKIPQKHGLQTLEDVKERVVAWGKRFGTGWQGLVLKTADGQRFKLRSNEYDEARALRGNQAKLPFLWLERWNEGRFAAYLRLYPEETHAAEEIVGRFKACTQEFHELFLKVFKNRELPLGQAPQKYRKLLWEARQAGMSSYFAHLRDFMNRQDTARKLWLVNYEQRYAAAAATPVEAPVEAPAAPTE